MQNWREICLDILIDMIYNPYDYGVVYTLLWQ